MISSATTVQELTRHIEAEHNGAVLNLRVFMDVAMDGRLLDDGAETLGAALQLRSLRQDRLLAVPTLTLITLPALLLHLAMVARFLARHERLRAAAPRAVTERARSEREREEAQT